MAKLVVLITTRVEKTLALAEAWQKAGAPGVTLVPSHGFRTLQERTRKLELPHFVNLATILKQVENVIGILAIISLSLAIVNLFPFLPLDGGHIFWAIVEKVRGRPVSLRVMERAGVVGFMLVIFIFLIGLSNDIGRLSGEGFQVR